jgi:hypothetical protein
VVVSVKEIPWISEKLDVIRIESNPGTSEPACRRGSEANPERGLGRMTPREVFLCHASSDRRLPPSWLMFSPAEEYPFGSIARPSGVPSSGTTRSGRPARRDWFLLVLSPAAVRSSTGEARAALRATATALSRAHRPLLSDAAGTRSFLTLDGIQRVDFSSDFELGCRDLFRLGSTPPRSRSRSKALPHAPAAWAMTPRE